MSRTALTDGSSIAQLQLELQHIPAPCISVTKVEHPVIITFVEKETSKWITDSMFDAYEKSSANYYQV
jgi:hypothetical protein